MKSRSPSESIAWLATAIRRLPSDDRVPDRTPGYNDYNTQKDHWIGWLNPAAGTGTYQRANGSQRDARDVYNRIVEPKLLLWLIAASGVRRELVRAAKQAAEGATSMAGRRQQFAGMCLGTSWRRHFPESRTTARTNRRTSASGLFRPDCFRKSATSATGRHPRSR